MKKILLILASMVSAQSSFSATKIKNQITDTFSDKVKNIIDDGATILVEFAQHSALYKIAKDNPRYDEVRNTLEKLKNNEKKVKVIAFLPMMEIKDITE